MVFISSALSITKRFNKAVAPKFLSWSLRLHESLSSSSSLPFSPSAISGSILLPFAQRLVSIEVQDDYRQLKSGKGGCKISFAWNNFVDNSWNVLFEDRHQRLKTAEQRDEQVEAEAQRQWVVKQQKRQKRQQQQKRAQTPKVRIQNQHDIDKEKGLLDLGEQRIQLLEKYIRPALLPTASSAAYNRHLFTHHLNDKQPSDSYDTFEKWLRGEYLIAKYGLAVQEAMKQYPELRDDAAGLSTLDAKTGEDEPLILPSVNTVLGAFDMQGWSRRKVPLSAWQVEEGDSLPANENDDEMLTIQQIIHHQLRGKIVHSGPLNAHFEMRRREDSYELWTREYIFGLAQYLLDRIEEMDRRQQSSPRVETTILDVGAGDGRLVYFLRRAMKEIKQQHNLSKKKTKSHPDTPNLTNLPTIIATDDGSWKAPIYNNQHIQVEQLSAIESLDKYGPKSDDIQAGGTKIRLIVLCSWMPPGEDWTADFRQPINTNEVEGALSEDESDNSGGVERLVEEYILIGEADDGTCGHHWYTWGNPDVLPDDCGIKPNDVPHALDGYARVDLEELSSMQFSRFDCKRSSESMTVSFRRGQVNT